MLTFAQYIEKAKEYSNIKTQLEIAKHLNITGAAISDFSKERSYPSQETVLKLANLAGVKLGQALIDFNLWKTKDKPEVKKIWEHLSIENNKESYTYLTFKDYVDRAKDNQGFTKGIEVANALEIKQGSLIDFSKHRAFPSAHTLLKLAKLANMSEKQALTDLSRWKTKNKPEVKKVWEQLSVEYNKESYTYLTFKDYLDKAKDIQGFKRDIEIAEALLIKQGSLSDFSRERNYPSQETVMKLANLAGIKPEQALIDLNRWKTKDKPNAHKVWQNLSKMIGCLSIFVIFCAYNSNTYKNINLADAIPVSAENVYYGYL